MSSKLVSCCVATLQSLCLLAGGFTFDREAQSRYHVPFLPGYGTPKETIYAGVVDVHEATSSQLYYIAYESRSPATEETPVLIWLNGGPGASSFLGNFLENGPYRLQTDLTFKDNPFAWNQRQHLIFFDQPAGTGFSHCSSDGYVTSLEQMAEQFVVGLKQLIKRHPQFGGPLHLTGESFSGQYIPFIGDHLVRLAARGDRDVNFRGVLIGNPGLDIPLQYSKQPLFFRSHGLVDERVQKVAERMVKQCHAELKRGETVKSFHTCADMSNFLMNAAGQPFLYDVRQWGDVFDDVYSKAMGDYFKSAPIAEPPFALHTGGEPWKNGDGTAAPNPVVNALINHTMSSATPQLGAILDAGYEVLIYNGAEDGSCCGHWPTENALKKVKWRGRAEFDNAPTIMWNASGVGHPYGNARSGGGLSFVIVLNCGHMVPTDQPEAGLDLLHRFLSRSSWTDFPELQTMLSLPDVDKLEALDETLVTSAEAGLKATGFPAQVLVGIIIGAVLATLVPHLLRRKMVKPMSSATQPLLA